MQEGVCVYVCVCVCAQRKRQREWEREIDFKELAHTIIEANEAKTCRVGQQAGDPEKRCTRGYF